MGEPYDACCPALSYQSRVVGFCLCFFTGLVLMFLADTKVSAMLAGNPTPFGVYYTFGNLVAIVGSFFLSGPTAQFNKMTEGSRIVSSAVYVLALAATLFFALDDSLPKTPRLFRPVRLRRPPACSQCSHVAHQKVPLSAELCGNGESSSW